MRVRVNERGHRKAVLAVDNLVGFKIVGNIADLCDNAVGNGDIGGFQAVAVGQNYVLNKKIHIKNLRK
jgi:hypothetical protein